VLGLGVAVRVILPLLGLAVGLQVVAGLRQQPGHGLMADLMPPRAEGLGEVPGALARPEQRRHRIAPGGGIDEITQVVEQGAIPVGQAWPTATGAADARAVGVGLFTGVRAGVEFSEAAMDGGA
jgi:hypothetical protein